MMNPVAIRLLNQQLVAPQFSDPAELVSYMSRDVVLSPEHRHHAHNNSGIFQPVIAYDGTICGNWSPFRDDCQATFFEDAPSPQDITEAWQAYKDYRKK